MKVIALVSGKGGVGKTSIAANLAVALAQRGRRVVLIDLDPQNALRFHLGMDPEDSAGLVREGIAPSAAFDSPFGIRFIPFGCVGDAELVAFEQHLRQHPAWVGNGIAGLQEAGVDIVLVDTATGPTVYLQQALATADRALLVTLPDAASYATVDPTLELVRQYAGERQDFEGVHVLINQMPLRGVLGHQVRTALYADHGAGMLPVAIRLDPAVAQALAFERPVLHYEPSCTASLDVQVVAAWLLDSLRA